MNYRFVLIIIFLFLSVSAHSQSKNQIADSILSVRGELYVSFPLRKLKKSFPEYSGLIIDKVKSDSAFLYLTIHDTVFLEKFSDEIKILKSPSLLYAPMMADSIEQVLNGTAYPDYLQYLEIMNYFQDQFPGICKIDTIGYSVEDRLILAARLSKNTTKPADLPVVFVSSTIHGDELPGYSISLMLINKILEENENHTMNDLLQNLSLIICPLENPDGTYAASDNTVSGAKRTNANFVDLNRNYPDFIRGAHPDGFERQKETQAMMEYLQEMRPSLSVNIHAGAEVVNYPWDNNRSFHPDNEWFYFISREYADTARYYSSGYMDSDEFDDGVVRGSEWYIIYGGRQDYVTYFLDGREITLELSDTKMPPEEMIISYWNYNYRSLLNYINQAKFGIHGIVYDSLNGEPLNSIISIQEYDEESSNIESDPETGVFFRYLRSGLYSLRFSAPGYKDKLVENVSVVDYQKTELTVNLNPQNTLDLKLFPNPFTGNSINLEINSFFEDYIYISFCNYSGLKINQSFHLLNEGYNKIMINTGDNAPGLYFLKIQTPFGVEIKPVVRLE